MTSISNMKIGKKIALVLGAIVLILAGLSGLSLWGISANQKQATLHGTSGSPRRGWRNEFGRHRSDGFEYWQDAHAEEETEDASELNPCLEPKDRLGGLGRVQGR